MKLHELHFANVNCLAGEWRIDLDDPGLAGLFVLSGPTGAGKSSILDAATLALFGRTARQRQVNGTTNEAMSRGARESFARAVFTGADGRRYEAEWSQRRVKHRGGRGGADFSTPEARLRDAESGEDLSGHRLGETRRLIEEKVGYGFEEFTRTVVLEQGEFDKFLHAPEEERAKILERATDTARFAEAGARVNERHKEEDRKREAMAVRAETLRAGAKEGRDPAEAEEEAQGFDRAAEAAGARAEGLRKETGWLKEESELAAEAEEMGREEEQLEGKRGERDASAAALDRAKRARALRGEAAEAAGARAAAESAAREEERREAEKEAAEAAVPEAERKAAEKEAAERLAEAAREEAKPMLAEARRLDGEMAAAARALEEARAGEESPKKGLEAAEKRLRETRAAAERAVEKEKKAQMALEAAREKSADTEALRAAAERAEEERRRAEGEYEAAARAWEAGREGHERRVAVLEERQRWAEAVKSLEDRRRELREGEACPLCGATVHPWAAELPALDDVREEIRRARKERTAEEKRVRGLEEAAKAARAAAESAAAAWRKADAAAREEVARAEKGVESAVEESRRRAEEIPGAEAGVEEARAGVESAEARRREREADWTAAAAARKAVAVGDADAEERELAEKAKQAAAARETAGKELAVARRVARSAAEELVQAQAARADAERARSAAAAGFASRLAEAGFGGEGEWAAACLEEETYGQAEAAVEAFRRLEEGLAARRKEWERRKAKHEAAEGRPAEGRGAEAVAKELQEAEEERAKAIAAAAALRVAIRERSARLEALAKAESELAAQEERCRKWAFLDDCLGGPGGKRFQLYAQGRNLRALLDDASPRLEAMSGGDYRFEWDPSGGTLEPMVRDRNFEKARPVSNLSGGESFLASLALALSFAQFNEKRAAVGTLFLDEGFGTLDAASLDRALDVLSGLRDTGRQVGLVTHVEQVKERVGAHIEVRKKGDGRSELSGPGVHGATASGPR